MAIIQAGSPFPLFTDKGGDPLDGGFVYFGEPDLNPEESPKTVYYDAELAIATPQPLRTSNGYITRNGSPAAIYSDGAFSMTVRDRNGALVFYSPSTFLPDTSGFVLSDRNQKDVAALLADTSLTYTADQDGTVVAGDIIRTLAEGFAYEVAAAGAADQHVTTAGGVKLYPLPVANGVWNIHSFGAAGDASTDDTTAITTAISYISDNGGGVLEFAAKEYVCTPFILENGVSLRGQGMCHKSFYTQGAAGNAGTVLLMTAGVGEDCITFEGPQRGMQGIENMSILEIGSAAFNSIISVNGALHVYLRNIEADCFGTPNRGISLLFARNATTSTGSIYAVVDNYLTGLCTTGVELRDDANAICFVGGSFAGRRYALLTTKVVTTPKAISFNGTSFEGSFDTSTQEIIFDNAGDNTYGYVDVAGVYVIPFVKLTCGQGITFTGCYFELGGTTGNYDDGVNGVAPIISVIGFIPALQADLDTIVIDGNLDCRLYSTSNANNFVAGLPGNRLHSGRIPTSLLLRDASSTAIPDSVATTIPFDTAASQNDNDQTRIKFASGVATIKERGIYSLDVQVRTAATIASGFFEIRAVVAFAGGGSNTTYGPTITPSQYATLNTVLFLAPGDTLTIQLFQTSGSAAAVNAAADYNHLNLVRLNG